MARARDLAMPAAGEEDEMDLGLDEADEAELGEEEPEEGDEDLADMLAEYDDEELKLELEARGYMVTEGEDMEGEDDLEGLEGDLEEPPEEDIGL